MPTVLTPRQIQVLDYIRHRIASGGVPTVREIAAHFGFASPKAISDHLSALERKGCLHRDPGRARNIRLAESVTGVPILGCVPAGTPVTAFENLTGRLCLPDLFPEPDHFALQVKGASMRDAGILDGDYVIVRLQPQVPDNTIVVAYLDGEATVKRLRRTRHGYRLMPENPAFKPIEVTDTTRDFRIAGPVVGLVRTLLGGSRVP